MLSRVRKATMLVAGLVSLSAQTTPTIRAPRGFLPAATFEVSEIESINVATGDMTLSIPLATLPPGRGGMSTQLKLYYTSGILDTKVETESWGSVGNSVSKPTTILVPASSEEKQPWRYGFEYTLAWEYRPDAPACATNEQTSYKTEKLVLMLPDNSSHVLHLAGLSDYLGDGYYALDPNGIYNGCTTNENKLPGGTPVKLVYYTADGSFLRLEIDNIANIPFTQRTWTLIYPDGRKVEGVGFSGKKILDRNGNAITIEPCMDGGKPCKRLRDDLGRFVQITFNGFVDGINTDTIKTKGADGVDLVSTVTWGHVAAGSVSFPMSWSCTADSFDLCVSDGDFTSPLPHEHNIVHRMVTKIQVPNVSAPSVPLFYEFAYAGGSEGWGDLKQVKMPSGLTVNYQHWANQNSYGGPKVRPNDWLRSNPIVEKSYVYAEGFDSGISQTETWKYPSGLGVNPRVSEAPDGGVTKYHSYPDTPANWNRGLVYRVEEPNGNVTEKQWLRNAPFGMATQVTGNPYVRTEYRSVGTGTTPQKTAISVFTVDRNGNTTEKREYDWVAYSADRYLTGALGGASLLRTTRSSYNIFTTANCSTPESFTCTDPLSSPTADTQGYWNKEIGITNLVGRQTVRDSANAVRADVSFLYDARGNRVEEARWDSTKSANPPWTPQGAPSPINATNGVVSSWTYDSWGNVKTATDPAGVTTELFYDAAGGCFAGLYPAKEEIKSASSVVRKFSRTWNCHVGVMESLKDDDNSVLTKITYDPAGRLIGVYENWNGTVATRTSTMVYDDANRKVVVNRPLDGRTMTSVVHYDPLGRERLRQEPSESANVDATDIASGIKTQRLYRYSGNNSYELVSNPYRAATAAAADNEPTMGWSMTKKDQSGRAVEMTSFKGQARPSPFGANGAIAGKSSMAYAAELATSRDEKGNERRSKLDGIGRLLEVAELGVSYTTTYGYDILGNLTGVSQDGQTRTFLYDSLSRLKTATNPESGITSYTYYDDGKLKSQQDARGSILTLTYNPLKQVTARTHSGSILAPDAIYCYDGEHVNETGTECKPASSAVTYAKGRLTGVANGAARRAVFSFDVLGRVTSDQAKVGSTNYPAFVYGYNQADQLTSLRYPSGKTVTYTFWDNGRAKTADGYATLDSYAPHGGVTQLTMANGLVETTAYNSRLQMTSLTAARAGTNLLSLGFFYCPSEGVLCESNNGSMARQVIGRSGAANFETKQDYGYDGANRLQSVTETKGGTAQWAQQFGYDALGNRWISSGAVRDAEWTAQSQNWYWSRKSGANFEYSNHFKENHAPTGACYDKAGHLIAMGATESKCAPDARQVSLAALEGVVGAIPAAQRYTWDGEGRMTSATGAGGTVSFGYDAEGRRVTKTVGAATTHFVYDAFGQLAAEYGGAAVPAGVQYLTVDHLGSTRLITTQAAGSASCFDYFPFGEELYRVDGGRIDCYAAGPPATGSEMRFTGKERDAETGLDYFGARYFASAQGRFSSPDPYLGSGRIGDPQTWNRYAYAGNNPLRFVDPTGLDYYDANGNRIGASGNDQNYIVTDKDQVNQIKKSKTVVAADGVSSAILLPNGQVISAMGDAVNRSNSPSGADTQGGFHEEGGQFGLDASGKQVAVASAPGAYANPQTDSKAEVTTGLPANPADAGRIATVQGTFHVHPKGEVVVGPQSAPGAVVMGGSTTTYNFNQPPSARDLANAAGSPGNTNFVLGARSNRVYIYNGSGLLTPNGVPLKNFLKIGSK